MTHLYRELCPPQRRRAQLKGRALPHKDQPCGVSVWVLNFLNDVNSRACWGLNKKANSGNRHRGATAVG